MQLLPITPSDIQWARDNFIRAKNWAAKLHQDDKDRGGTPYFQHLAYVATKMQDSIVGSIIAWFHDSIEHKKVSAADLLAEGFPLPIVQRIELLSKRDTQSYEDYIISVSKDFYTRRVKMYDLDHNLQLGRLEQWDNRLIPMIKKYMYSLQYLREADRAAPESNA